MIFFFFKQKTAYEMRISDWSSDVCSSDLAAFGDDDDVDDRARASVFAPVLRGALHHVPAAVEVVVDDRGPAFGRVVDCRLRKLAAGIVDGEIEPAAFGVDALEQRIDQIGRAHV